MASQHINYNHEFTDDDLARLCQIAPYANDPFVRFYVCLWQTDVRFCNLHVRACDLPDHLRSYHGVILGGDRIPIICHWVNCHVEVNKDSLMRHISENHLELKHTCPTCHEQFARFSTLQVHISRKHSG